MVLKGLNRPLEVNPMFFPDFLVPHWQEEASLMSFLEDRQRGAWKIRAELQDRQQRIRDAQSTVTSE